MYKNTKNKHNASAILIVCSLPDGKCIFKINLNSRDQSSDRYVCRRFIIHSAAETITNEGHVLQSKLNLTSSREGSALAATACNQYRLIWLSIEGVLSLRTEARLRLALLCFVRRRPTLVFISAIFTESWLSSELRRDSTDTWRRLMLICES